MKSKIYKVKFNCPPREDGRTEYFFNTLTAIYKIFTKKEIGCDVRRLWNLKVSKGHQYVSRTCTIVTEVLHTNDSN